MRDLMCVWHRPWLNTISSILMLRILLTPSMKLYSFAASHAMRKRVRRGSFIKKVRLTACAPKHPYNTKTHLAQELCSPPLNGLEGVPQPRPLPHLHTLPTMHIHQVLLRFLLQNTSYFSPCGGDSEKVRPFRPGPKRLLPERRGLHYEVPFIVFIIGAARHGPSREKKGGKTGTNTGEVWRCQSAAKCQHTQLGGAQTEENRH